MDVLPRSTSTAATSASPTTTTSWQWRRMCSGARRGRQSADAGRSQRSSRGGRCTSSGPGCHGAPPTASTGTSLSCPCVLHLEDEAYWEAVAPLRRAAGLPVAYGDNVHLDGSGKRVDFSGNWRIDESAGVPGGRDSGTAETLQVLQGRDEIVVARTVVSEYEDAAVTTDRLALDGTPERSEVRGAPRGHRRALVREGRRSPLRVDRHPEPGRSSSAAASRSRSGSCATAAAGSTIRRSSTSPWGRRSATVAYERR